MIFYRGLPPEQIPFSQKNKEWRQAHIDWADKKTFYYDNSIRNTIQRKRINYNLVDGVLTMDDVALVLNPDGIQASYLPEKIQHYPIINSKLNVLRGEEYKRRFDFKVIVTNPNSISVIEENRKTALHDALMSTLETNYPDQESFDKALEELKYTFSFNWQDIREQRANKLLRHYSKEYNMPLIFNKGYMDALITGEEIYLCNIVSGEPTFEKLNPLNVFAFRNSYSSNIEDSDIIVLIDYWSPAKIQDTFYEDLKPEHVKYLDELPQNSFANEMDNIDERNAFINMANIAPTETMQGDLIEGYAAFAMSNNNINYFDNNGNVRVLRVYWKSKRAILKVKSFNIETGEEQFDLYPENYQIDKNLGEELVGKLWISEAWEGTKIGKEIYINVRPRKVQYNRLSNPSRCHFGIVGTVYNLNSSRPYSLVDMMRPFSYLYDVIKDQLLRLIATNWGKLVNLDLAWVPKGWEIDKWLYFAKVNKILVRDSFKEGNIGTATGKLAGAVANTTGGSVDAELGNSIQSLMNILEYIKAEMGEVAGISKQREGQISNRETVGGVERATLQSSYITEWLFAIHDDTKRRALECFIETAKIALRGSSKKFNNLLSTGELEIVTIDGDEFAENDYGLVVDSSPETANLTAKLEGLAQAALQNNTLSFSTIMKVYTSSSLSEIQRMIEKDERDKLEQAQRQVESGNQAAMQKAQQDAELEQMRLSLDNEMNIRDNQTKLAIAEVSSQLDKDGLDLEQNISKEEKLLQIQKLQQELTIAREKLQVEREKNNNKSKK